MTNRNAYLQWLSSETATSWWHDSADPAEIEEALSNGATGVTTNPLLVKLSLFGRVNPWAALLAGVPANLVKEAKAEEIIRRVTVNIASGLAEIHRRTAHRQGYVCAQVNPRLQANRDEMFEMARRLHGWAPNIAVKLPVTAAGLDVLEECAAEGITVTATVSFSVPQALEVARRYEQGLKRAEAAGIAPGECFAVIMIGRVDDYLKDVAHDNRAKVEEADLVQGGVAMVKYARSLFRAENRRAVLMPSGMRSARHVIDLAGGDMILSVGAKIQEQLAEAAGPFEERIDVPIDPAVLDRLLTMKEFRRAYEPDGMKPEEFIAMGSVQRTLSQFTDAGWACVEAYRIG